MKDFKFHPLAEQWPLMSAHDLGRLEEAMRQHGFDGRFPIILYQGLILDGRNRFLAAKAAEITPSFERFEGTEAEAALFVQLANEERRHLDADWLHQRRQERIQRVLEAREQGQTLRDIAKEEGVSHEQVRLDAEEGARAVNPLTSAQSEDSPEDAEPELHRRIREYLIANPAASNKAVHRALDCSEHTVKKVRVKMGTVGDAAEGDDAKDKPERRDTSPRRPPDTNGKPTFDDRTVLESLRKASVILNNRAQALGLQKSKGWRLVQDRMNALLNAWEEWQKERA